MLKINNLYFQYDGKFIFTNFSAKFNSGITWVRGANGSGKTTLLKILGGMLTPNQGRISLNDVDYLTDSIKYKTQSFYCGESTPYIPWLSVREIIDLHSSLYPGLNDETITRKLKLFNIDDVLDQSVNTLSLGQHKKLQLALAFAIPLNLILIDEPFNGLDKIASQELRNHLINIAAEHSTCMLLTSHLNPQIQNITEFDL